MCELTRDCPRPLCVYVLVWQNTVLREVSSFNQDFPEGGFDGLAQVMACKDVRCPILSAHWSTFTDLPHVPGRSLAGEMVPDTLCCT